MKLTKKQVEKAAQAAYDHDDMSKRWEDASFEDTEKEEWYGRIRAAFAAIEPEPVEVPQDLVEKMLDAYFEAEGDDWREYCEDDGTSFCAQMTAALRVALEDERVLGDPTVDENDEWLLEKFRGTTLQFVSHIIANRRARLLKPKTPDSLKQPVVDVLCKPFHTFKTVQEQADAIVEAVRSTLKAEQESQS